jgi:hypothetical protein
VRVLPVAGEPRRMVLARLPQPLSGPAAHLAEALRQVAAELSEEVGQRVTQRRGS